MNFDDIIIQLGQFGAFQRRQYFLLCLPAILCAFHQLAAVFLAATPDFRCKLSCDIYNSTDSCVIQSDYHRAVIQDYIPVTDGDTSNTTSCGEKYEKCKLNSGDCQGYVYSDEYFTSTIVTEWDIVCDDIVLATTSTSIYMAGVLTGAFVFGIISDIIGRKKTLLICIFLQGATGMATAFSPGYYYFIVLRFFAGSASMGLFMTCFVLGLEFIGPKYRLVGGIVIEYFFALGYVLLTGIAYVTKRWDYLQIAISAPSFIFLIYFWFISESARWLLIKGRTEEAENIVKQAAKVNGVTLPDQVFHTTEEKPNHQENVTKVLRHKKLVIRSLIIFFNWMVVAMGYYGLSLNSGSIGGNIYINFMLGGLVEFPAYTVCFLCNKLGRKVPHVTGMMIGGLACLGTVLVDLYVKDDPSNLNIYFVVFNTVGKFGMTIGFCIIYFWSAELYPTTVRNSMMGFSSTLARVGSIAAPYVGDLGNFVDPKYKRVLPASIFGSLVIVGGLMSIALPETTGKTLPENIKEADRFPNHTTEVTGDSKADLIAEDTKF